MRIVESYLIVNARGDMKIRKTRQLKYDEIAFRLKVHVPDSWGRVQGNIELEMPDVPMKLVETGVIHLEPDEAPQAAAREGE
jgi:hypothetical protein